MISHIIYMDYIKLYAGSKEKINNLNTGKLIEAINAYAHPVLTYCFGIVNWTNTELEEI